jgi:hypothetical protein
MNILILKSLCNYIRIEEFFATKIWLYDSPHVIGQIQLRQYLFKHGIES